jgi:hypothetical protein
MDSEGVELGGNPEGVLTTDRDQRVDPVRLEVLLDPLDASLDLERVGPRGAKDGSTARKDAANLRDAQFHGQSLEWPLPPVPKADEFMSVFLDTLPDYRPNDRVESGAVSAASENADTHAL